VPEVVVKEPADAAAPAGGVLRRSLRNLSSALSRKSLWAGSTSSSTSTGASSGQDASSSLTPRSLLKRNVEPSDAVFVDTALVLVPEHVNEFSAEQLRKFRVLVGARLLSVDEALFLLGQVLLIFPESASMTEQPFKNMLAGRRDSKLTNRLFEFLTEITKADLGFVLVGNQFAQMQWVVPPPFTT